jgi:DNA invertase Pin-like site-specific DNA recombinase
MTEAPKTLAELQAIPDPAERARAARLYIERADSAKRDAQAVRDDAIRLVLKSNGPTATARLCDVSVSTVKLVRSHG